jgi:type II secretory pathway component PulF
MRTFEYRGFNHDGQAKRGLIEALDLKDAREKLSHQGVLAESVHVAGERKRWVWRRRDVLFTLETRAAFYRELASILGAGLPLSGALTLLVDAPEMGNNRSLIAGVRDGSGRGSRWRMRWKRPRPKSRRSRKPSCKPANDPGDSMKC